ncbi:MAG TPA: MFS transporter, partial [Ideonella sp.]|nr:MFS transporter [Ideonella sp.]
LGAAALAVAPWLPRPAAPAPAAGETRPAAARSGFSLPDRAMLGLGCMVFCSFLVEGAMADWSAVFLHDKLGTSASQAAFGYAAFSLAMTVMRLFGDHLIARFGAAPLLRGLNLLGALALTAALASAHAGATVLAFAFSGLGVATVVPTVFSAAARREGQQAGRGIATMASFGYTGFLLGPPLIGWLAEATDLRVALGLLPLLTLAIVLLLPLLQPAGRPQPAARPCPAEPLA